MLRHVVCITFRTGTEPEVLDTLTAALRALPAAIPEIRGYACGADLALGDGNAEFAIVADFDDIGAWKRYQAHPEHVRVLDEYVRPFVESRVAVQFEAPTLGP